MKKGKKILMSIAGTLASIAVIATVSTGVFNNRCNNDPSINTKPDTEITTPSDWDVKLMAPTNLSYDDKSYLLDWEDPNKEGVGGYNIYLDGELLMRVDAADTEEKVTVAKKENKFQVQALAGDVFHRDSDLSEEYTYVMPDQVEQSVFNKVNKRVAKDLEINGYNKFEILGISSLVKNRDNIGANFYIEVKAYINEKWEELSLYYIINEPVEVADALNNIDAAKSFIDANADLLDYKTADRYLKRDVYDGKMQELREQGYTFTTVNSAICKGEGDKYYYEYDFVATYKAERGGEVLYITTRNNVYTEGYDREKRYYETYIINSQDSRVIEKSSVIYTDGAMMEFMTELLKTKETTNEVSYNNGPSFSMENNSINQEEKYIETNEMER